MMTTSPSYKWNLRQIMAERGLWKTSELGPLLGQRGVSLSSAQVYRLVANTPERLSLKTLAALCDIFACSPSDLIEITTEEEHPKTRSSAAKHRPRRARVGPS
jgi:DNA-binding Xre family transcriptional regulator